jgi:outer membrane protein assembly factor BamB
VVDLLDFPLAPPDGDGATGGRDFGQYRSRFGLYHAGEDWRHGGGTSSFGKPVYSIGHGVVTYAEPLGWGADKGVVIVRHTFSDGSTILSFYGHLDPPSVVLSVGDCVARGDRVGQIGRPRTSPHLHLEIRTHMPDEPGRGYSPEDPTLSGWKAPSQFIWQRRIALSPGVLWLRSFAGQGLKEAGMLDEDTSVAIHDDELVAIDIRDGSVRWRQSSSIRAYRAMVHPDRSVVYVASWLGEVEALRVPGSSDTGGETTGTETASPLEPLWQIKLEDTVGFPTLMPLPGGDLLVLTRHRMVGVSSRGEQLWERDALSIPLDWLLLDDQLLLAVAGEGGSLWSIDQQAATAWEAQTSICLALSAEGDRVFAYDKQGIVLLDPRARSIERWYALPDGLPRVDDLVALPDGGVLATHTRASGGSLTALHPDGTLRWRRSYAHTLARQGHLLALDGKAYFVSRSSATSATKISIFEVDLDNAELVKVFDGGSQGVTSADTWAFAIGEGRILINLGSTGMLALDMRLASEAVRTP